MTERLNWTDLSHIQGLPGWLSVIQKRPAKAGVIGLIPESERSPGEGTGNPLQYSCLGNPMDRGTWWATVHGVTKSQILLSDETTSHIQIKALW